LINERRRARRAALQALFEVDQTSHSPQEALAGRLQEEEVLEESADLAAGLVQGVLANKRAIDERIASAATTWPLHQMAPTDRIALEIGVYEMCMTPDTPVAVAINEAVELAKTFGGEHSGALVNAVLRGISERSAAHSPA